jgi:beta-carotene hydroxylase
VTPRIPVRREWIGAPSGTLANPTVGLLITALAMLAAGALAYADGTLPVAAVVALQAVALYLIFTPLHEAMHGVAHEHDAANEWIGRIAGAVLTISLPLFRAVHYEHHSHTNDPARDPDHVVARRPRWLLPLWSAGIVLVYRRHFYGRRLWWSSWDRWESLGYDVGLVALLVGTVVAGYGRPLFVLWIGPALLAVLVLGIAFDFLPHYPYDSRARYHDTRIYGGAALNAVLLGQNQHLVHHLWTTIPWFRYRSVVRDIGRELELRGCRMGWRITPLPAPVDEGPTAGAER